MSKDRVLLIDVDGVLITPPDWYGLKLRREAPDIMEAFFKGPFMAATIGQVDLVEHLPPFIESLGRTETPEEFLSAWHEYENYLNQPVFDEVKRLRVEGWRVYLATNQERQRLKHLLNVTGLSTIVDGDFASCTVGFRKPTRAYFTEVTQRLGVSGDHIFFVDDVDENIQAAISAGWNAHLFVDLEGFEDFFKSMPQ